MDPLDGARVTQLWRYPVKSMRGERIDASAADAAGLRGDRAYAVVDVETGKVGSAKHPRLWADLLRCSARCAHQPDANGAAPKVVITLPDGSETASDDPDVHDRLSSVFGRPVRLTTEAPEGSTYLAVWPEIDGVIPEDFLAANSVDADEAEGALTDIGLALAAPGTFFDVSALHVVTEATLRRLGELAPESTFAVERYRPNVVLDVGDRPFAENDWSGSTLTVAGELQATVLLPTMRCIMTTLAQGDLPRDADVLRTVARHNRVELPGLGTWSCVGAYAAVTAPGPVRIGDAVTTG